MTETDYWQALRKKINKRIYAWKINANYAAGIPDWWASGSLQDLWIENKRVASTLPPLSLDLTDHKKYLTVQQQKWLERRYNEGRNIGVIVFSQIGHLWLPGLTWQKPISRLHFQESAMPMKELADKMVEICGEMELK
jgi:hypothetical protein